MTRATSSRASTARRWALAGFGLASGLACASCGTALGLAQNTALMMMNSSERDADRGRAAAGSSLASSSRVGSVSPVGSLASVGPEKCHPVESVVIYGGETVPSYGRACEMPDGSWVVTASTDPARAMDAISGSSGPPARTALYAPGSEAGDDPHCAIGRRGFMSGPFGSGYAGGGWGFHHRGRR
jgi:hypothetical protein